MRTIARYPEVRKDGALFVPLKPPPAPTYEAITAESTGLVGRPATVATSTEWIVDVRVLDDPFQESNGKWYVRLCTEGAWFDLDRNAIPPRDAECVVAALRLVFIESGV